MARRLIVEATSCRFGAGAKPPEAASTGAVDPGETGLGVIASGLSALARDASAILLAAPAGLRFLFCLTLMPNFPLPLFLLFLTGAAFGVSAADPGPANSEPPPDWAYPVDPPALAAPADDGTLRHVP